MMDDNERCNSRRSDPFGREAKRAAWRARRAARHAGRGDWSHFGDPKFWGLDAESMKAWGFGGGPGNGMHGATGMGAQPAGRETVAELEAKVAEMERTIASMNQRIIVLEKLIVNDDARLAAEIEKLRDIKGS